MRVRLNAGKPATVHPVAGLRAPEAEEAAEVIERIPYYPPNSGHDDVHLKCGHTIPWPVIQVFGSNIHGQILCDEHGYQPKITKAEIERARKESKKCPTNYDPSMMDPPPF